MPSPLPRLDAGPRSWIRSALGFQHQRPNSRGQSVVELALILPVLLALVLGALDFGRVMQARVTAESAAKAGASWGASHFQNATANLPPAYDLGNSGGDCGSATLKYPPTCNILARACAEAAGLPRFSGTTPPVPGYGGDTYQVCSSGSAANVCQAAPTQSNPFLVVTWADKDGNSFTASNVQNPPGIRKPVIGDSVTVTGTYCFKTFFPGPMSQLTWTSSATYTVQP
jgi:hypothetical protein